MGINDPDNPEGSPLDDDESTIIDALPPLAPPSFEVTGETPDAIRAQEDTDPNVESEINEPEITVIIQDPSLDESPAYDEVTQITHAVMGPSGDAKGDPQNGPGPVSRDPEWRPGTSGLSPICLEDEDLLREPDGPYRGLRGSFYPEASRMRRSAHTDPFTPPPREWHPPEEEGAAPPPEETAAVPRGRSRSNSGFYVSPPMAPPPPPRPSWQLFTLAFLVTVALSLPAGYAALASGHLRFLTPGGTVTPEQIEHPTGTSPQPAAPRKMQAVAPEPSPTPAPTPCLKEAEWSRREVLFRTWRLNLTQDRSIVGSALGVKGCALRLKMEGAETERLIPLADILSSEPLPE